jgi:hypothetical protein
VVEGALGLSNNRPTIGGNVTREVEDLLRTKRPFYDSNRPKINKTDKSIIMDSYPSESNNKFEEVNKDRSRHIHKKSNHKHSHRHHTSRHKRS